MNIGIDIDDTINNVAAILKEYAKKYNELNNIKHDMDYTKWGWDIAYRMG